VVEHCAQKGSGLRDLHCCLCHDLATQGSGRSTRQKSVSRSVWWIFFTG